MRRAAVVLHGKPEQIRDGAERLEQVARVSGVKLVDDDADDADLAVVLGGDGTMLRALHRFLGTGTPVLGVNFGRVGFLSAIEPSELEAGLARVFSGEYEVVELPTLDVEVAGASRLAVNDVVVTSSTLGRMIVLGWSIGDEDLGVQPCDGLICATPAGSTAYNLSNGGPVLVWGIDAMVATFVAPHSLSVRPLVIPRGLPLSVRNETPDVDATVLVDGHEIGRLGSGDAMRATLDGPPSLLATLPEVTFFRRYRDTFA